MNVWHIKSKNLNTTQIKQRKVNDEKCLCQWIAMKIDNLTVHPLKGVTSTQQNYSQN